MCRSTTDCSWLDRQLYCQDYELDFSPSVSWIFLDPLPSLKFYVFYRPSLMYINLYDHILHISESMVWRWFCQHCRWMCLSPWLLLWSTWNVLPTKLYGFIYWNGSDRDLRIGWPLLLLWLSICGKQDEGLKKNQLLRLV